MLQLIITYIWFGANIPQDYLIKLSEANYPIRILINPIFNTTLELNIQKSDRFRLQILKQGGTIYADFDTKIFYSCLMNQLQEFNGQIGAIQKLGDGRLNNNFLYVPKNKTRLIKKILAQNPEKRQVCKDSITGCNGPDLIDKYKQQITYLKNHCVAHYFDWSWWKDSNKISNLNSNPKETYAQTLVKKREYIKKFQQQKIKIKNFQEKIKQLQKKVIQAKKEAEKSSKQLNSLKNQTLVSMVNCQAFCGFDSLLLGNENQIFQQISLFQNQFLIMTNKSKQINTQGLNEIKYYMDHNFQSIKVVIYMVFIIIVVIFIWIFWNHCIKVRALEISLIREENRKIVQQYAYELQRNVKIQCQ